MEQKLLLYAIKPKMRIPKNPQKWYNYVMSSNLINHKNYTENSNIYQLKLPLELDGLIPEDDSVRLLSQTIH